MRIVAVNVGGLREMHDGRGRSFYSGIEKSHVSGPVSIGFSGVIGDAQGNQKAHGGPDNAVYVYSADHYAVWRREEHRDDLAPGFFGENLTVAALHETDMRIGDLYRAGHALLEVTQARAPCATLGLRFGEKNFPDRFLASRRMGMYLRVLKEGDVQSGDEFHRERTGTVPLLEAVEVLYGNEATPQRLQRLKNESALSRRWRDKVDLLLAQCAANPAA